MHALTDKCRRVLCGKAPLTQGTIVPLSQYLRLGASLANQSMSMDHDYDTDDSPGSAQAILAELYSSHCIREQIAEVDSHQAVHGLAALGVKSG